MAVGMRHNYWRDKQMRDYWQWQSMVMIIHLKFTGHEYSTDSFLKQAFVLGVNILILINFHPKWC